MYPENYIPKMQAFSENPIYLIAFSIVPEKPIPILGLLYYGIKLYHIKYYISIL